MFRRGWRVAVLLVLAMAVLLVQSAAAGAAVHGKHHKLPGKPRGNPPTQLVITDWNVGQGVDGFIADTTNPFNPTTTPYPSYPPGPAPPGFTHRPESFAGLINAQPPGGGTTERLYCIDIRTNTTYNNGYVLGTWNEANVPNVGYVARILEKYYPNNPNAPAGLTDSEKAAAVQAAIWYFSDKYVLTNLDPLHGAVAAIVAAVQTAGPVAEPPPPTLTISPSAAIGRTGGVAGPFTVNTGTRRHAHRRGVRTGSDAAVTATGGTMYSDDKGTLLIPDGASVPSGTKIWLRATPPNTTVVLQATATATVPSGNVYLFDGGANLAQKLILAHEGTLITTVKATAEFRPPGSLIVKKTIAGPAAGSQGKVVIHVACDDGVDRADFVIDAGTPAGTTSTTYDGITAGTLCTVTETSDGSTVGTVVDVVVVPGGEPVTIPSDRSTTVNVTDTYRFVPGSLIVRKTIAGPAAGQQGAVTIHTVCNPAATTPDFVIPAGAPAGTRTMEYDQIPANATCTVTETADGHTSAVSVVVEGSPQTVPVPAGHIVEADLSDTYGLLPGQLEVTKTIAGPQAGQQGQVVIHTVCTPAPAAVTPDFVIPAGTPAGDQSQIYSGVPAGASCVVTETADGHTSAISVVATGSPHTTTIAPGGAGAAHITDTYGPTPGSLLITKTIAGPLAGHQGPVTIHVACNGIPLSPDYVIAAGTPAGNVSHSFDGIPAGSVCTVTETTDGATATVTATVAGNGQNVTVPAGKVVSVSLMDVYQGAPGFLRVIKDIRGPAARQHGRIAILVACGGPLHDFAFLIPARTPAGSVSRWFAGLPAESRCTVTEVAVGRTNKLVVVAIGKRHKVTIHANGSTTVHLTDTFSPKPKPRPKPTPPPSGLG